MNFLVKIYPCSKGAIIYDVMQLGVDTFFTQFTKSQLKPAFLVWQGGRDEINLGGVIFEQPLKDLPFFDSPSFFVTLKMQVLIGTF